MLPLVNIPFALPEGDNMKRFTIREIENYTGIKQHTFRVWERRYALVVPMRTGGNVRFYSLEEVRKLLTVALLYAQGLRISQLVSLTADELEVKAAALQAREAVCSRTIFKLIVEMYACEIELFEATLDQFCAASGPHQLIEHILIPFMEKIRLFSYREKYSEVHFVTTVLRKKLIFAIECLSTPRTTSRSALLFLPLQEHFDLVLLYMAYILKKAGWKVWYLGTDISIDNLQSVLRVRRPDVLLTYQCPKQKLDSESYSFHFNNFVPKSRFLIAGCQESRPIALNKGNYFYFTELLQQLP